MQTFIFVWQSLRPKQWTKNLFIFAGILFSQNIFNSSMFVKTIAAFFIFCILSGSVYILNDIVDLEKDKSHPVKSQRPLVSGKLKISSAVFVLIVLAFLALIFAYCLEHPFFLLALAYFLLQLLYSFVLKHIVILDVFAIASGFVLRVMAGALVIDVEISSWFIMCTILLSLFLGLSKRRHELVAIGDGAQNHRRVLGEYSPYMLDQMISVVTASTVVAYSLYTISEETVEKFSTRNLIFTIPFVLYGIFRYLYLIHQKELGGEPEVILVTDKPLIIDIILWAITVGIILYGNKM